MFLKGAIAPHLIFYGVSEMFRIEIETGHDATTYYEDVAELLNEVAQKLQGGIPEGNILDRNGNIVGRFEWEDE